MPQMPGIASFIWGGLIDPFIFYNIKNVVTAKRPEKMDLQQVFLKWSGIIRV